MKFLALKFRLGHRTDFGDEMDSDAGLYADIAVHVWHALAVITAGYPNITWYILRWRKLQRKSQCLINTDISVHGRPWQRFAVPGMFSALMLFLLENHPILSRC